MKYRPGVFLLTIFVSFFIASTAFAVDVVNGVKQFHGGNQAKASEVNTVHNGLKTAIDANATTKQDRVTGTCLTGQSIRVIYDDGSVDCEVDSNSGGDITSVTAGTGLSGGGGSGPVTLSLGTQTRYLALPGTACFRDTNATPYYSTAGNGLYCRLVNSAGTVALTGIWPVNLPNGATVNGMRVRLYTSVGTTTCRLRYGTSNSGSTIATVVDSTSGWHNTAEATLTHTVNTASNAYYVACNSSSAGDNPIGHIRIRYTY